MLEAFFQPASVAVIGASNDPQKLGYAVLKNLIEGGYAQKGEVYPINLTASEILGHPAYPTVAAVPGPIDLAVLVTPSPHVPAARLLCRRNAPQRPNSFYVAIRSAGHRRAGHRPGWTSGFVEVRQPGQ